MKGDDKVEMVYLGADHAGFETKEKIKKYLERRGIYYEDFTPKKKEGDDYPDYAFALGKKVADSNGKAKGILVCGSGTGMIIAANKVKGVRAVMAYDIYSARMSRHDNDTNVIALRGRSFPPEKAVRLVDIWLKENFSGIEKDKRRIRKISNYEK